MSEPVMMSASCPLDSAEMVPAIRCAGRWLCEVRTGTGLAERVADFIRRRFLLAYGADPVLRIPELLALTSAQGSLLAAVGVRAASGERLFLEDYLEAPVQTRMPGGPVPRRDIAEIAHLAGVEAGVSRYLFASLAVWLDAGGFRWVVCTGTDQLRNSFHRMGISPHMMAPADPSRLPDGGAGWGQYYDHHPVVMAVSVEETLQVLAASGMLKATRPVADSRHQPGATGEPYGDTA